MGEETREKKRNKRRIEMKFNTCRMKETTLTTQCMSCSTQRPMEEVKKHGVCKANGERGGKEEEKKRESIRISYHDWVASRTQ